MNRFDEITKGDWVIENNNRSHMSLQSGNVRIADFWGHLNEKVFPEDRGMRSNVDLVTYSAELAQKYNIEHFQDVVEAFAIAVEHIEELHKKTKVDPNSIIERYKEVLKAVNK